MHYQCVFYGGRLLSHLTADDPDLNIEDVINILKVNRNAIVLMDSDKKNEQTQPNRTKKRIAEEIEKIGERHWITKCREIENYIPPEVFKRFYKKQKAPEIYQDIKDFLNDLKLGEGDKFEKSKAVYAERFISYMTKKNMLGCHDWEQRISECAKQICNWNKITLQKTML